MPWMPWPWRSQVLPESYRDGIHLRFTEGNDAWRKSWGLWNIVIVQWWFHGISWGFHGISWKMIGDILGISAIWKNIMEYGIYPLVNVQKAVENHRFLVGKSTISTGPFSLFWHNQRVVDSNPNNPSGDTLISSHDHDLGHWAMVLGIPGLQVWEENYPIIPTNFHIFQDG